MTFHEVFLISFHCIACDSFRSHLIFRWMYFSGQFLLILCGLGSASWSGMKVLLQTFHVQYDDFSWLALSLQRQEVA